MTFNIREKNTLFKFKIIIVMNGQLALNGMISDEEIENKEDVCGGEDSS